MEQDYKVGQYVYSEALRSAMEVLPKSNDRVLFTCNVREANKYKNVFSRLANGNEIFHMLAKRERIDKRLQIILKNIF